MKITRLSVKDFLGIEALDTEVSPSGAVVSGRNASGKSSVLKAIQTGLAARKFDPTAIRVGAEKAEILIDLGDISVRRVITKKNQSVTVTDEKGFRAPEPATKLRELLGESTVDPIQLFHAKKEERRRLILAALPVTVTIADLKKWAPTVPGNFDCSGHGLDVVSRLHDIAYKQRTDANAAAKKARVDADRARDEAATAARDIEPEVPTVASARSTLERAKSQLAALEARAAEAARGVERTRRAHVRIALIRKQADDARRPSPDPDRWASARANASTLSNEVERLRRELAAAEAQARDAIAVVADFEEADRQHRDAETRASALMEQAAELEATIADATAQAPSTEEISSARGHVDTATLTVGAAEAAERAAILDQTAKEAARAAKAAEDEAGRLDSVVKALANDAPASLLAAANGIKGLTIEGDAILLDGRNIESLSTSEQLKFSVEIAKRLNGTSGLMLVDKLESLDPEQLDTFIHSVTADGTQLIATRVAAGERVIEAIEIEAPAQAAE